MLPECVVIADGDSGEAELISVCHLHIHGLGVLVEFDQVDGIKVHKASNRCTDNENPYEPGKMDVDLSWHGATGSYILR